MKVKVGPITAQYKGTAKLAEVDEANRRIVIDASGPRHARAGQREGDDRRHDDGRRRRARRSTSSPTCRSPARSRSSAAACSPTCRRSCWASSSRTSSATCSTTAGGGDTSHAAERVRRARRSTPRRGRRPGTGRRPRRIDSPEAEPVDLLDVAGDSVTSAWCPSGSACVVLFVLWRSCAAAEHRRARADRRGDPPRPRPADPSRIEPVFDPAGPVLGHRPRASRAAATAWSPASAGDCGRSACGVIRTAARRSAARPARSRSTTSSRALVARVPAVGVAVERVLFQINARTAMSVGQASGLALVVAAARRHPGRAVQPERGEARGHRRRPRRQGRGADDGRRACSTCARSRSRPTPPTRSRSRAATSWRAPLAAQVGGRARDRLGARHGASSARTSGEVLVEVGGVGYRVLVPLGALAVARAGRATRSCSRTCTCAKTRWCSTASRRRDERDTFEALIAATGVGPEARARDPVGALARRACAAASPTTTSTRSMLVPGVGKRTAQRLLVELKARLEVPDLDLTAVAGAPASTPRAEVRDALAGLGYSPDEVRDVLGQLADDGTVEDLLRDALRLLAGSRSRAMREELLQPDGRSGRGGRGDDAAAAPPRRVRRPAAPARAPRDHARPRRSSAGRPSTTCCSPGPPGLGKTTLAGHHRRRDGRAHAAHERSRARTRRRPRRDPHQPRRRRRAVHRRDPPPAARRSKRCSIPRWRTSSSTS